MSVMFTMTKEKGRMMSKYCVSCERRFGGISDGAEVVERSTDRAWRGEGGVRFCKDCHKEFVGEAKDRILFEIYNDERSRTKEKGLADVDTE